MCTPSASLKVPSAEQSLHARFIALLPKIERCARTFFGGGRCASRIQEQLAEVIGLCWKWFVRLAQRGKDASQFPVVLAQYACRAVRSGRRLCGQEPAKDVMSPLAQRRHGFRVELLPSSIATPHEELYGTVRGQRQLDAWEERLRDNTQTPVPEQAAFRLDFATWLARLTDRDRRIVRDMAMGERTQGLANTYGITPGRVSQKRREFHEGWLRHIGESSLIVQPGADA